MDHIRLAIFGLNPQKHTPSKLRVYCLPAISCWFKFKLCINLTLSWWFLKQQGSPYHFASIVLNNVWMTQFTKQCNFLFSKKAKEIVNSPVHWCLKFSVRVCERERGNLIQLLETFSWILIIRNNPHFLYCTHLSIFTLDRNYSIRSLWTHNILLPCSFPVNDCKLAVKFTC